MLLESQASHDRPWQTLSLQVAETFRADGDSECHHKSRKRLHSDRNRKRENTPDQPKIEPPQSLPECGSVALICRVPSLCHMECGHEERGIRHLCQVKSAGSKLPTATLERQVLSQRSTDKTDQIPELLLAQLGRTEFHSYVSANKETHQTLRSRTHFAEASRVRRNPTERPSDVLHVCKYQVFQVVRHRQQKRPSLGHLRLQTNGSPQL